MDFKEMFARNYKNLTSAADNFDVYADKLETGLDYLVAFVEQADGYLEDTVQKLRDAAEQLRAEAATKTDGIFDDVAPQNFSETLTREQKIEYIVGQLKGAGVTGGRWNDPSQISDEEVNRYYRLFGGR